MIFSVIKGSPIWIKTTITSWLGTATGLTISIGAIKEDLQAWAALVGGMRTVEKLKGVARDVDPK